MTTDPPVSRVRWLSDLVRLEIVLWERVDAQLKQEHGLPLAHFETLWAVARAGGGGLRVGELAVALRITVGGASKLVDRMESAGLIRRDPDGDDRRASRVGLTAAGERVRADAAETCEAAVAALLDGALGPDDQRRMHDLVTRLLAATEDGGRT